VQISGFGNFETRRRAARKGRNPATNEVISIRASVIPAFRPGQALKDLVNKRR
jgi:DNA-binding protein HU-beta